MKLLKCNKCKWVHFQVTREYAESEVQKFNKFFHSLTTECRKDYYGNHEATMKIYTNCSVCGNNYKDFSDAINKDCPNGCTIGPILQK